MANAQTNDWAWPALIQSLQHDIARLHETVDSLRRDTSEAREQHREELDALIEQLRQVRDEIKPIVQDRRERDRLARETRWSWLERLGWVVIGGLALAVWELFKRNFRE